MLPCAKGWSRGLGLPRGEGFTGGEKEQMVAHQMQVDLSDKKLLVALWPGQAPRLHPCRRLRAGQKSFPGPLGLDRLRLRTIRRPKWHILGVAYFCAPSTLSSTQLADCLSSHSDVVVVRNFCLLTVEIYNRS